MNHLLKTALATAAISLAASAGTAHAAAYKCQDDKGKTIYSDIPCARKEAPAPKPEAKIITHSDAVLTKLTEADVLRVLALTDDYTRSYNHADMCGLYSADLKYQSSNQLAKPPRTLSGGREEACRAAHDSADQSMHAGLVVASDRGNTKVVIEPGELRASAVYETTVKLTRYDRVISTYHCSAKSQFVLLNGKALFSAVDEECRP